MAVKNQKVSLAELINHALTRSPIELSWPAKNIAIFAGSMETKWKYKCKNRKYTLVLIFHNWLWAGGKCHQSWWMPPPAQIEKLTILTWPIWDGSTAPSFVISNHNSMSRLSLSNPPSALIFIVLKVDASSCFIFVNKNEYLVKIYGSIFGRSPGPWNTILPPKPL